MPRPAVEPVLDLPALALKLLPFFGRNVGSAHP
jgi:hypothetical protein